MSGSNAASKPSSDERVDFRLTSEHKALIEKAAAYSGESLTGFVVSALLSEARRIVQEHETVVLSTRDRDHSLELLDNPPAPPIALRRAVQRHRELVDRSE